MQALLDRYGLVVEKSAVFGMQSNNPRLLRYAVQGLIRHPVAALRCYNWLFFPIGLLFQQRLKFWDGLMELEKVHEVLLVCRRGGERLADGRESRVEGWDERKPEMFNR